jgi:hypothetical protein
MNAVPVWVARGVQDVDVSALAMQISCDDFKILLYRLDELWNGVR